MAVTQTGKRKRYPGISDVTFACDTLIAMVLTSASVLLTASDTDDKHALLATGEQRQPIGSAGNLNCRSC
jgi:hypothetical protein